MAQPSADSSSASAASVSAMKAMSGQSGRPSGRCVSISDPDGGCTTHGTWRGREVVLMLGGGDKSTQKQDIAAAKVRARRIL